MGVLNSLMGQTEGAILFYISIFNLLNDHPAIQSDINPLTKKFPPIFPVFKTFQKDTKG